uniref:LysM domain-containing protein n=1 Tax=Chlamydomonas leiostraca TaxID=1034604 RepID=A0A7S0WL48_9CHLO|mmetsp:Transcript_17505/g.44081  ORF Transcript_17505/g.44081 Transcript_17505/m.44081 type:complete len:213 (+) Transcript_17505:127-765(+)|eukprot:CAMPEP_0202862216 /NCGR_PEP_ID=MMETSP1391-20130828/3337_1 /ASSEMBLY_ACC=CAM_ASM_000867 /TAXON_ID=1034604 /ORGANISM="Chlamydomonas leiostraca, Strain SAG 11-49" /LENGTH=212 /DNA_ID=CAMNT_0049541721 /DNA_START=127 /DNA_END=765 /DNA_ORIENTATION=-
MLSQRLARPVALRAAPSRQRVVAVRAGPAFQGTVRPYTLRKGDTIESIAKKRDLSLEQLLSINPELDPKKIHDGQTILLPAEKLSARDREILDGIGTGYRVYPVREGETIKDIISKRKITMEEMQSLNPGIDFNKLTANQILKLPASKFTVREREMLIGSGIVPPEFFEAARNPFVIGFGVLLGVCGFVLAWMKFHKDPDFDDDAPANKTRA